MSYMDNKYAKLTSLGYSGTISDMEWDWLYDLCGTVVSGGSYHINGLWHIYWDRVEVPPGPFNDRAYWWLTDIGVTGDSLPDLWYCFWEATCFDWSSVPATGLHQLITDVPDHLVTDTGDNLAAYVVGLAP